jgi:hypothetical protein
MRADDDDRGPVAAGRVEVMLTVLELAAFDHGLDEAGGEGSGEPLVLFEDPARFGGLVTGNQVDASVLHRYLLTTTTRPAQA